jgi:diguanylate cyclase (GGDEF)-like protein
MGIFGLCSAWVVMRGGWQGFRRLLLVAEKGPAWVLLVTGWIVAGLYAWRAVKSLSGTIEIEFNHASDTNNALALVMMVGVFSVNIVFAQIVFGRATAELLRLSRHDALTGLFNRRAIVESMQIEWDRFKRSGVAFSVVCIDIDHFKQVNDAFGHAAGDAVLAGVAQRLRLVLRPGDGLGRIGGEEFLAVLNGCEPAEALVAAERLRLAICDEVGLHPDEAERLTISLGVATARADDQSAEDLLARGDAALYEAKAAGRNVVCQAADKLRRLKAVTRSQPPVD